MDSFSCICFFDSYISAYIAVMILSFRRDWSRQTVSIDPDRTAPEEQSDCQEQSYQGLHCLLFRLHTSDKLFNDLAMLLIF